MDNNVNVQVYLVKLAHLRSANDVNEEMLKMINITAFKLKGQSDINNERICCEQVKYYFKICPEFRNKAAAFLI